MKSCQWFTFSLALACACIASQAGAQSPSAIYTWDNTGNASPHTEQWTKHFGTNTATFSNATFGELTITETGTSGTGIAIIDDFNRIRESSTVASGGLDLTGLDYLEYDIGHNGAGPIAVQFYLNARSPCCDFVALGPDLLVTPGMNTYQVPLTGLTPAQAVYVRTVGFNARDHVPLGNVVWTLQEVRSGGTPLKQRTLITHDTGVTPEGGIQGAFVNFGNAAILGNDGGQNQTGLSHNSNGSGSLQFTSLGAATSGGAISWGNGTALNGNTFNNRAMDISNYEYMTITLSATDPNNGGGTVGFNTFVQRNNFAFQGLAGSGNLPIDGQFHEFSFPLAGITNLNVTDVVGLNIFDHAQDLIINVDSIRFRGIAMGCFAGLGRGRRGC
jgi:hypothetical protein